MSDLIDREKLLEHVKDLPTFWADAGGVYGCAGKYPNGMFYPEYIISSIENAPCIEVPPVKWISVNDRLPTLDDSFTYTKRFLLTYDGKRVQPMWYEKTKVRGKVVFRWLWIWDRIYDGDPITHWAEMPEPPKGE